MHIKKFKIPKKVRLPGVVVHVQVVAPSKLAEDSDGEWCYVEGVPTIQISSMVSAKRKRYLLYHELQHAIHDILHVALQDFGKEVGP